MGKESAGDVIWSGPCSCLCCTWICFQETPLLSQWRQDTMLLPGAVTTKKQEVTINLEGREVMWNGQVLSCPLPSWRERGEVE